ncbi:hypothetical protein HBI46_092500 [Parastagonospora nodorum]|nr:hypothetical protein HBI46_092500 [Parastagonospora nodorum]
MFNIARICRASSLEVSYGCAHHIISMSINDSRWRHSHPAQSLGNLQRARIYISAESCFSTPWRCLNIFLIIERLGFTTHMPAFSTTTVHDRTTAAVLMMGSLQAYFHYVMDIMCGIPTITLLGQRADYEDILQRLDKLDDLGPEAKDWASLLRPIMRRFVASFDPEMSSEVKTFWSSIVHHSAGSGQSYLSGWLTAFCFWDSEGVSMYYRNSPAFSDPYTPVEKNNICGPRLQIDGVWYACVDTERIPTGFASVPVTVIDNGVEYKTKMVAGSLGIGVERSGEKDKDGVEKLDSVRGLSGWVMYELVGGEEKKVMKGDLENF